MAFQNNFEENIAEEPKKVEEATRSSKRRRKNDSDSENGEELTYEQFLKEVKVCSAGLLIRYLYVR